MNLYIVFNTLDILKGVFVNDRLLLTLRLAFSSIVYFWLVNWLAEQANILRLSSVLHIDRDKRMFTKKMKDHKTIWYTIDTNIQKMLSFKLWTSIQLSK